MDGPIMLGSYVHWRVGDKNLFSLSTTKITKVITMPTVINENVEMYATVVGIFRKNDLKLSHLKFEDVAIRDVKKVTRDKQLKFICSFRERPGFIAEISLKTFERLINRVRR